MIQDSSHSPSWLEAPLRYITVWGAQSSPVILIELRRPSPADAGSLPARLGNLPTSIPGHRRCLLRLIPLLSERPGVVQPPVHHHPADGFGVPDILERVLVEHDQVGEL